MSSLRFEILGIINMAIYINVQVIHLLPLHYYFVHVHYKVCESVVPIVLATVLTTVASIVPSCRQTVVWLECVGGISFTYQ